MQTSLESPVHTAFVACPVPHPQDKAGLVSLSLSSEDQQSLVNALVDEAQALCPPLQQAVRDYRACVLSDMELPA